jgi:hypothetical protein
VCVCECARSRRKRIFCIHPAEFLVVHKSENSFIVHEYIFFVNRDRETQSSVVCSKLFHCLTLARHFVVGHWNSVGSIFQSRK